MIPRSANELLERETAEYVRNHMVELQGEDDERPKRWDELAGGHVQP